MNRGVIVPAASNQGVGSWIDRRARLSPGQIALIHGDTRRTYAELAVRVRRLARGLRSVGVQQGDRIGWLGSNHPAFIETLFASTMLGAVMTPINHRLEPGAIDAIFSDAAPRLLVVESSLAALPLTSTVPRTLVVGGPEESTSNYEQLINEHSDEPTDATVSPDELCLLVFTSGTTGGPKGVKLTHANVTWNAIHCLTSLDLRHDDVTIAAAPFFRAGGTGLTVLPLLFAGGTVVIPRRTDPDEIFDLLERHRVTIQFGNPELLDALTQSPLWYTADLASLRAFITGGSPVSARLLRRCHERHLSVLQGYGLTEAAPLVSVLDAADDAEKADSVGRPALFVDVRIVDDNNRDCTDGTIGELLVRGPNVTAGYWNRPDATRRAFDADSWLRTGDAARIDAEGFLFIIGRMADAYVSAGEVVHPGLVERALLEHAFVAEACVVGDNGHAVAYIVLKAGAGREIENELIQFCRTRLPARARPTAFEFVAMLPKNPAGKVMRHLLRGTVALRTGQV